MRRTWVRDGDRRGLDRLDWTVLDWAGGGRSRLDEPRRGEVSWDGMGEAGEAVGLSGTVAAT